MRGQQREDRADQRSQLIGIVIAFTITLSITLLVARRLVASIRRPLAALSSSARRLGSGDLAHRVELESFTEFNQVADSFNAMANAAAAESPGAHPPRVPRLAHRPSQPRAAVRPHRPCACAPRQHRRPSVARGPVRRHRRLQGDQRQPSSHSHGDEVLVEVGRRIGRRPASLRHVRAAGRRRVRRAARRPRRAGRGDAGRRADPARALEPC